MTDETGPDIDAGVAEKIAAAKAAAGLAKPPTASNRPTIVITVGELERIVNEIEAAILASDRGLYQRGEFVVAPGIGKMKTWDGKPVMVQVIDERGNYALLEDFEVVANFEKYDKRAKKNVKCAPGLDLVYTFKQRKNRLRLPYLVGVINCPSIKANGELVTTPGYDEATGILYDPLGVQFPPVPDRPTKDQAGEALKRVKRLIRTFPFVGKQKPFGEDEAPSMDRSAALSLFITPLVRAFLPSAPLHGLDAPIRGSGKSKLVDIASVLVAGHRQGVTPKGKTDEETEKRFASLILRGDRIISLDNVDAPIEGELFNQVLTQESVNIRPLGFSKSITVRCSFFLTINGNNLVLKGDLDRRSLLCRLDPQCPRPELEQFSYNPIADARQNRGPLVADCLTVLRAYHIAGQPTRPPALQEFNEWSDTVRSALMWLGEADPVKTMERIYSINPVITDLKSVLGAWHDEFGEHPTSSNEAIRVAVQTLAVPGGEIERSDGSKFTTVDHIHTHPGLRNALLGVAGRSGKIDGNALGQWLRKHVGRIVDIGDGNVRNYIALDEPKTYRGVQHWATVPKYHDDQNIPAARDEVSGARSASGGGMEGGPDDLPTRGKLADCNVGATEPNTGTTFHPSTTRPTGVDEGIHAEAVAAPGTGGADPAPPAAPITTTGNGSAPGRPVPPGTVCDQCSGPFAECDVAHPFAAGGGTIWLHPECVRFRFPGKAPPPGAENSAPAPQAADQVPFMITIQMRWQLQVLRYTPAEISRLTPAEALAIIKAGRRADGMTA